MADTIKTLNGIDVKGVPESLKDEVFFCVEESTVYHLQSTKINPVFFSWWAEISKQDPSLKSLVSDAEIMVAKRALFKPKIIAKALVDDNTNVKNLNDIRALVRTVAEYGASDMHILIGEEYTEIQIRVKGKLYVLDQVFSIKGKQLALTLFQGYTSSKDTSYQPTEVQNGQINGSDICPEYLTSIRLIHGPKYPMDRGCEFVVARFQYKDALTRKEVTKVNKPLPLPKASPGVDQFDAFGFTERQINKIKDYMMSSSGLILVTGPTGSGKTTLLYEMLRSISRRHRELRQITIEDPVEYPMPWAVQMAITNAKDEESTGVAFEERLRAALRMDPDIILVGEIRGSGSALAALDAARTGHLVFSTMHVTDPFMCIDRMELFDPVRLNRKMTCDHRLIVGLIGTRLVPILCDHCKIPFLPEHCDERMWELLSSWHDPYSMFTVSEKGCDQCNYSGISRQQAVSEFVKTNSQCMDDFVKHGTDAARKNMRASYQDPNIQADMSMLEHVMNLVRDGKVDPHDIRHVANLITRDEALGMGG